MAQQVKNERWELLRVPGSELVLYHLDCKKTSKRNHTPIISIIKNGNTYKISASARIAGAPFYREVSELDFVNEFLVKLGYPRLP